MLAVVSSQATWVLILMPLLGLALSVLLLYGFGLSSETLGFAATGDERPAPTLGARMENLSASRRSRGSDRRFGGVRGRGGPLSMALGADPPSCDHCHCGSRCRDGNRGARSLSRRCYRSGSWRSLVASAYAAISRGRGSGGRCRAHGTSLSRN